MSETTKLSFIGLRVDKDMKRQLFEIKRKDPDLVLCNSTID